MISIYDGGIDFRAVSTDVKPTDGVPNGAKLLEIDTNRIYFYDAENHQWIEWID